MRQKVLDTPRDDSWARGGTDLLSNRTEIPDRGLSNENRLPQ